MAKDPASAYANGAALGAAALAAAGGSEPPPRRLRPWWTRRGAASGRFAAPRRSSRRAAAELLAALEHAAARAARLREALADMPPESVERRLAEVRAGQDPGKARLVAALAQHLAVQRRMQAAAGRLRRATTERILLELETVRGRVLAEEAGAGRSLGRAAETSWRRSPTSWSRRWGIRHLGWLPRAPRGPTMRP